MTAELGSGKIVLLMTDTNIDNDNDLLKLSDGWYFIATDLSVVGPYRSRERAEAKWSEYRAYTEDAPGCHHPKRRSE